MASVNIIIKHKGKKYDVEVDTESTGEVLKYQMYTLTNVEPDRQKIIIKGGQLKDDDDLGKLNLKPGQTIMMMGDPSANGGAGIKRPSEQVKFVEDMTEAEQAQQDGAVPSGLVNLGNTCYLNSTLQILRSIPELQQFLSKYEHKDEDLRDTTIPQLDLTNQLKLMYKEMSETQQGYSPHAFLTALRTAFPQFAERAKSGRGFAQQDAEEAWSQIVGQLTQKLKIQKEAPADATMEGESSEGGGNSATGSQIVPFVDRYMSGEFVSTLECNEQTAADGGEQPSTIPEKFLKLSCHIDVTTNHLRDGILAGLTEEVEKKSTVLDRDAMYTKRSKIARLPKYLTVHFVRFFWKRDVQKKAKIMRKVTFPHELDVVEFCTDELKKALVPVRDKVREVRKDEEDIERARKRRKKNPLLDGEPDDATAAPGESSSTSTSAAAKKKKEEEDKKKKKQGQGQAGQSSSSTAADGDVEMADGETYKTDAEVDAEKDAALLAAKKELHALIDPDLAKDEGANPSGLYELRGVVTHQGASADSGHYTAYVKKTAPVDPATGKRKGDEDGNWWWFNDDKVSEVTVDKIDALSGGGEAHSALILLYRAIPLPSAEGVVE